MTNEEIAEAAKAYAPNSLALKIPTTIREYQKRDIEAAFIAGAKWVIKKLSEHSQNQNCQTQQEEQIIAKACEWLDENLSDYNTGELIHFFKKAMEEQL